MQIFELEAALEQERTRGARSAEMERDILIATGARQSLERQCGDLTRENRELLGIVHQQKARLEQIERKVRRRRAAQASSSYESGDLGSEAPSVQQPPASQQPSARHPGLPPVGPRTRLPDPEAEGSGESGVGRGRDQGDAP